MSYAQSHRPESPFAAPTDDAQRALDRALQLHSVARMERLVSLTNKYPAHGPTWLALAEEHAAAGRNEEAAGALRRALRIDRSLKNDVSRLLRGVGARAIAEAEAREEEEAPAESTPSGAVAAAADVAALAGRVPPAGADPAATQDLAQAMKLPAEQRCDRLAELALVHPAHGPTWLALAEEHLAERRIEYAVSAYERALAIDPALHSLASRKLEALHRYHRQVRPALPQKIDRTVAQPAVPAANPAPAAAAAPNRVARGTTPPPSARPAAAPAALPAQPASRVAGISDNSLHIGLARALELPDRDRRLAALEDLERKAPDAPSILFHLALELALAGRAEPARKIGERLMQLSPPHYRRLYEVAERHWPSQSDRRFAGVGARCVEPTKILSLPPEITEPTQEAPQPSPQPIRTQILPELLHPSPHIVSLPAPPVSPRPSAPRASSAGVRALGFLAAGVLMGVVLVVILNWLLPGDSESVAPSANHTAAALATSPADADSLRDMTTTKIAPDRP